MTMSLVTPCQSVSPIHCVFVLFLDITYVDYMIYSCGSQDNCDHWSNVTGDSGWGWEAMTPCMLKLGNFTASPQVGDASSKYSSSVHDTTGTFLTLAQVQFGETD